MFKSVQIKMILIIIALAVVMLAIPEYIYLARLNNLNVAQNPEMLAQSIATWKIVLSILTGSFLIISTIIVIFTSKNVVSPISKLIKKVERIAAGDETEQIELKEVDNGKSNTEIDELVKAFNVMTAGLKENLNEVTRQKMQIETILLHMTDGIIAFNIDGSIIHINPAASRLLKITADDNTFDKIFKKLKIDNLTQNPELLERNIVTGRIVLSILTGSFLIISAIIVIFTSKNVVSPISKLIKKVEKIAAGDETEQIELKEVDNGKSNTEIDELVKAFNVMTAGLKENLNEVTRQKMQIETILLHMTDGIIAFNIDGSIIHINPAASRLLKITADDNTFDKIFKKLKVDMNMEKIIYLENWTSTEQKLNIDDMYVNMFFAPFKDENNRPAGVMVLIQDITEHVRLDNMRKEFVADVSHELKTPLTSILGYSETLATSEYDKELQTKFLNVISSEAVRMTKLVNDLLTLSKYDNKKTNTEKTEFDLGELVKQAQENLQIEMDKKHQKVECFVTANVPNVYADRDGIERVVLNILSNSIKYTGEGGTIKIYVGFVYNDAYIKVIDNGIGIPEEDLNKIFERFYRVDKARTREMGGTGLGLSIAKEILDQNNGRIDIKSKVHEGTEVVITIPTKSK